MTTQPTLAPAAFAQKWRGVTDHREGRLPGALHRPVPDARPADSPRGRPTGEHYAFEKRVGKAGGGDGFADVWKRDFFAWEYKGPRKDLKAAYVQLSATRTTWATRRSSSSATSSDRDPHQLHRPEPGADDHHAR